MEKFEIENMALHENLSRSAKWARYLAYITFASVGLSFLQLIFGIINNKGSMAGNIFSFIISTVITLILATNLLSFSKYANMGLLQKDRVFFTQAFTHLKNYFLVIGAIFLILLGLLALFIIVFTIVLIVRN
jgi:hypothetical protein